MSIDNFRSEKLRVVLKISSLLLAAMFSHGCASPERSGSDKAADPDLGMPSPGKAKLIFVRPTSNGGIDIGVHDGERLVAKLPGKSYGVYECDPGEHVFSGSFGNVDILNAKLMPDRIYYVNAVLAVQAWGPAWVKMTPLHPGAPGNEWQKLPRILGDLRKTVVTPEQAEHDRKGIDRYMERLKVYRDKPGAILGSIDPEFGQTTHLSLQ